MSGDDFFSVAGSQVIGTFRDATPNDANGTIALDGAFTTLTFNVIYTGPGTDGIYFTFGATPVPEPATSAAVMAGFLVLLALGRCVNQRVRTFLSKGA